MTETTKVIFEKYEVRKTKKQKTDFIEWVKSIATQAGYDSHIEKGLFGARNIVIGNPDKAKVIYTAHYDTCARLPFPNFITPKCFSLYLLYSIAVAVVIFTVMFGIGVLFSVLNVPQATLIGDAVSLALLSLMLIGPANKHTANDNTSGVTVVLDTLNAMPPVLREDVAFILFDMEEVGLLGSSSYSSKHKKALKDKLLINFDCVSDGSNILVAVKKKAKQFVPVLKEAFQSTDVHNVEVATKGVFYPSDQENFPCGVAVAALKGSKRRNILYIDRIHTKKDTVYQENNISYLVNSAVTVADLMARIS